MFSYCELALDCALTNLGIVRGAKPRDRLTAGLTKLRNTIFVDLKL